MKLDVPSDLGMVGDAVELVASHLPPGTLSPRRISFNLRTALAGIVTGCLVGIARIAGETAPLLFTTLGNLNFTTSVLQPMQTLSLQIFVYATGPFDDWHRLAWGSALVLMALVLASPLQRYLQGRSDLNQASQRLRDTTARVAELRRELADSGDEPHRFHDCRRSCRRAGPWARGLHASPVGL